MSKTSFRPRDVFRDVRLVQKINTKITEIKNMQTKAKLCKQVRDSSVESNGFDGRLKTKLTTARGRLKAEASTIVPLQTKQPEFIVA